ncbi:MAG TPA: divergent polysaccharide deacetylase family protein [Woeseiaceae bacterium]|nr:divergent polysaccharide deacetylase family protein [Woeseiaceae bacterium]
MTRLAGLLIPALLGYAALSHASADGAPPRIAIIIDDLGYGGAAGERTIRLPGPVACSVLPGTPHGVRLARLAHAAGKQVMLHLPMQSLDDIEPAPGLFQVDTTRAQLAARVAADLAAIPHVTGINNHRGSLLTRHPGHMAWLMEEIAAREGLFFVDSYTTAASVALGIARESGIPAARRDVFLDPEPDPATVRREFDRLLALARRHGTALAIGHPYPATLALLEKELPRLAELGIELVSPGELVRIRTSEANRSWPPSSYRLQTASKK